MQSNAITFKLGDDPQEYKIQFDFNEVCEAESVCGCNLMRAIAGGEISAAQTRGLLYACLKTAHPVVTLSEAGGLLSKDINTVLDALAQVLQAARDTEEAEPVPQVP